METTAAKAKGHNGYRNGGDRNNGGDSNNGGDHNNSADRNNGGNRNDGRDSNGDHKEDRNGDKKGMPKTSKMVQEDQECPGAS